MTPLSIHFTFTYFGFPVLFSLSICKICTLLKVSTGSSKPHIHPMSIISHFFL